MSGYIPEEVHLPRTLSRFGPTAYWLCLCGQKINLFLTDWVPPSSRSNPMQHIREKIDRLIKNLTLVMEPIGNGQSTCLFGCVIRICSTCFLN